MTLQSIAGVGGLLALLPFIVGDFKGVWPIIHVTGGAMALFALIVCGWRLPPRQRLVAMAGVVISLVVISIVSAGGAIGTAVQIAVLIVLGAIYVAVVFVLPEDPARR